MTEKIEQIKNKRERHFAQNFFSDENWIHQPERILFGNGDSYRPDFLDKTRNIYIEVIGTRQAFYQQRYKYRFVMQSVPDINLEFRLYTGELIEPEKKNFSLKKYGYTCQYRERGDYVDVNFKDKVDDFVIGTGWALSDICRYIKCDMHIIRCMIEGGRIRIHYLERIEKFFTDWENNKSNFPPKYAKPCPHIRKLLSIAPPFRDIYIPYHPDVSPLNIEVARLKHLIKKRIHYAKSSATRTGKKYNTLKCYPLPPPPDGGDGEA
jgi:hypothetical protein